MNAANAAPSMGHAVADLRPYLMRFARRHLKDPALIEDVVQDTIVSALQGAAQYAGRAALRTWLTTILLRRMADAVRRETRAPRAQRSADAWSIEHATADIGESPLDEHWIDRRDPERTLAARQALKALESRLARLPATAASIVVKRGIDGLSTQETARALDLPPTEVSLTLHRARSLLRAGLPAD